MTDFVSTERYLLRNIAGTVEIPLAAFDSSGRLRLGFAGFDVALPTDLFALGSAADLLLVREAADTLALRRTTNQQNLYIYNTYTSALSFERAVIGWGSGNVFHIGTEKGASGGSIRDVYIRLNGTDRFVFDGTAVAFYPTSNAVRSLGLVTNNWIDVFSRTLDLDIVAFASLPAGAVVGAVAAINNCSTTTWGANADGAGASKVLVWFNGTNWTVVGK